MKPLIVSFFLVIFCFSFFIDDKKETKEAVKPSIQNNSVNYGTDQSALKKDSIIILKDKTAALNP